MTLSERIDHDLKEAMKARDAAKLGTLRMVKSAFKYAAIEKSGADAVVDDEVATYVLRKQIKQREDAAAGFEQGGRPEMAEKEKAEIAILVAYLPAALSTEELAAIVRDAIAEVGASLGTPEGVGKAQMGAVMKAAQAKAAGRADGKSLSAEVQKQLS
ncbi:MAG: GatB/YqeY domain-containing protein [Chthoniobacterales bacterium]